jgi:opacity protein-like surface antigen
MMTAKKIVSAALLIGSASVFAGGFAGCGNVVEWKKVTTLSGGVGWTKGGETQSVYIPGYVDTYLADKDSSTMGTGELFFALQWPFTCGINNQLGIAIGGTSEAKMTGQLYVNGAYSGSNYVYHTNHSRIAIRGKMMADPKGNIVQPYITASVGVAFNAAYGYETIPWINPTVSSLWFDKKTSLAFTYSAGLGLEKTLSPHWAVGVGYEFSDWGKSGFNQATTQPWVYDGPQLTHMYEHRGIVSISYRC